jgi:solute carrier family 12 sodium/potassium/chloride transporter 2
MLALLISMFSYAIFVMFAGATAVRDASGFVENVANGTQFYCFPNRSCDWGLMNSYSVRENTEVD